MLTFGGIRPLCGLISLILVGSVHFVNRVDPWWDPSTLRTVLTLGGIRPLCGLISLTLVGSVHFLELYKFDPSWVRPLCGNNLSSKDTAWS